MSSLYSQFGSSRELNVGRKKLMKNVWSLNSTLLLVMGKCHRCQAQVSVRIWSEQLSLLSGRTLTVYWFPKPAHRSTGISGPQVKNPHYINEGKAAIQGLWICFDLKVACWPQSLPQYITSSSRSELRFQDTLLGAQGPASCRVALHLSGLLR